MVIQNHSSRKSLTWKFTLTVNVVSYQTSVQYLRIACIHQSYIYDHNIPDIIMCIHKISKCLCMLCCILWILFVCRQATIESVIRDHLLSKVIELINYCLEKIIEFEMTHLCLSFSYRLSPPLLDFRRRSHNQPTPYPYMGIPHSC